MRLTRAEAIEWLIDIKNITENWSQEVAIDLAIESLSAKWITDRKPTEEGTYMVTVKGIGHHRFIDLMDYGKPLLPNKEVSGKCWYDSDNEWSDVVYDDEEILAWLPLPKPYREDGEV